MTDQASFTCPRCAATSSHPDDVKHGYCGRCHDWTGDRGGLHPLLAEHLQQRGLVHRYQNDAVFHAQIKYTHASLAGMTEAMTFVGVEPVLIRRTVERIVDQVFRAIAEQDQMQARVSEPGGRPAG